MPIKKPRVVKCSEGWAAYWGSYSQWTVVRRTWLEAVQAAIAAAQSMRGIYE